MSEYPYPGVELPEMALEDLVNRWGQLTIAETSDTVTVVFQHETTGAICQVSAERDRIDLGHTVSLHDQSGAVVSSDAFDHGHEAMNAARHLMEAFDAGVQTRLQRACQR